MFSAPRPSWRLFRAALLLAVLPATIPLGVGAAEPAAATEGPKLEVDEISHNFGTVPQGEALRHEFRLTNRGTAVLTISDVKPACGCTTTGEWPKTLAPGASGVLPIKLDTAHFAGPLVKTIAVQTNDAATPTTILELKATVWMPVAIGNPVLIFPALTDPTVSATRTTTIRHEEQGKLTLSDLQSDNPHFRPQLKEIEPGKLFELSVTSVPPLPDGSSTGRITLRTSNEKLPEISIQAVVTVLPAVQVAPSEFAFTTVPLANPEKRFAVVLRNRGADVHVTDLTTDAPGVVLSSARSPDGKQFTITLSFPAGFTVAKGAQYVLRGKTDYPAIPSFEIPIVYAGDR